MGFIRLISEPVDNSVTLNRGDNNSNQDQLTIGSERRTNDINNRDQHPRVHHYLDIFQFAELVYVLIQKFVSICFVRGIISETQVNFSGLPSVLFCSK